MPASWPARGLGLRGSRAASCSSRVMQHRGCTASAAPIDVVQADDVVLAEIAARLPLDQFERDPARIGEPMDRADRDVDRLVLMHGLDPLAAPDLGGAPAPPPVVCP